MWKVPEAGVKTGSWVSGALEGLPITLSERSRQGAGAGVSLCLWGRGMETSQGEDTVREATQARTRPMRGHATPRPNATKGQ